jgi:hypothetical protein
VAKKQKAGAEPSLRDRLSANLLAALEEDFRIHGVAVIEKMREAHPERYIETAAKLIMSAEPPQDGWDSVQSIHEMGARLLESVGVPRDAITETMVEAAIAAQDNFTAALAEIGQGH